MLNLLVFKGAHSLENIIYCEACKLPIWPNVYIRSRWIVFNIPYLCSLDYPHLLVLSHGILYSYYQTMLLWSFACLRNILKRTVDTNWVIWILVFSPALLYSEILSRDLATNSLTESLVFLRNLITLKGLVQTSWFNHSFLDSSIKLI